MLERETALGVKAVMRILCRNHSFSPTRTLNTRKESEQRCFEIGSNPTLSQMEIWQTWCMRWPEKPKKEARFLLSPQGVFSGLTSGEKKLAICEAEVSPPLNTPQYNLSMHKEFLPKGAH